MSLSSSRPYIVRAMYEWMTDNDLTPQIVVDATAGSVIVPGEYVQDGSIVLNISAHAVRDLDLGNDRIEFGARFGGTPRRVSVPVGAVTAIVARENGVGMTFSDLPADEPPPEPPEPEPDPAGKPRPALKIVK